MAFNYGAEITSSGISIPTYQEIYDNLVAAFQQIYGPNAILTPQTQDGQLLGIIAQAINDTNQGAVAVYQSFSPTTASGTGLSSIVQINGIQRKSATNSTAIVTLTGTYGTVINSGVLIDTNGNLWNLPSSVTIPFSGSIQVTATAQQQGAIEALPNTINQIQNPVYGWQSATNPAAATVGQPIETDAQLRVRQTQSVAIPSIDTLGSIIGNIGNLTGVTEVIGYQNDTGSSDISTGNPYGLLPHSIAIIVGGGTAYTIAQTINKLKTPGTATQGNVTETVIDQQGISNVISFYTPTFIPIYVTITVAPLQGWVSTTAALIQTAIFNYINGLQIGQEVSFSDVISSAVQAGNNSGLSNTYSVQIVGSAIGTSSTPTGQTDIAINFNEQATTITANIIILS